MSLENKKIGLIASTARSFIGFRLDLIKDFVAAGFKVYCIAPEMTPEVSSVLKQLGCECYEYDLDRAGMNILKDCRSGFALFRILRKIRPDTVLAYTIKPVIYGMLAARFSGVKRKCALISGLGYAFTYSPTFSIKKVVLRKLTSFLYRISLSKNHTVIFQNSDDQNLFEKLNIVSHAQSRRVDGSGVNLEEFPHVPLKPSKKIKFLMVARLIRDKGVYEYAQAAEKLKTLFPDAECHLAGTLGPEPSAVDPKDLETWVKKGIIFHHGHVKNMKEILEETHVFVLPSYYREGVPRSSLEALSIGRPVIMADSPGCREVVAPGKNGFLVEPRNPESLVNAMSQLLQVTPKQMRQMGEASRAMAEERFDVRKVNSDMFKYLGIS